MAVIISGKDLAASKRLKMKEEIPTFIEKYGRAPHLVVILVGNNPASKIYVRNKSKACEEVGIEYEEFLLDENTQNELFELYGITAEKIAESARRCVGKQ